MSFRTPSSITLSDVNDFMAPGLLKHRIQKRSAVRRVDGVWIKVEASDLGRALKEAAVGLSVVDATPPNSHFRSYVLFSGHIYSNWPD
jgi:hypothetical protein